MEDLVKLISDKKYTEALREIEKNHHLNPPFFESLAAYIRCLEPDSSIEKIFSDVIRNFPKHPEPWKFMSIIYSDRGFHKKSYDSLKICYRLGNNSPFVMKRLFNYSLHFKDSEFINRLNLNFTSQQIEFLNSLNHSKTTSTASDSSKKIFIDRKHSLYKKFLSLRVEISHDQIPISSDESNLHLKDNTETSLMKIISADSPNIIKATNKISSEDHNKPSSEDHNKFSNRFELKNKLSIHCLDEITSILGKNLADSIQYMINYEFKRFFLIISQECKDLGFLETSVYALNAFFIIQNVQMDRINFYTTLFDENKFDLLKELLNFENNYHLSEALELGRKLLNDFKIRKIKCDHKKFDQQGLGNDKNNQEDINDARLHFKEFKMSQLNNQAKRKILDEKMKIINSILPNSCEMIKIFIENQTSGQ